MDELPRWNKLINELKDRPDKEGDGGNLREQLNVTKKLKITVIFQRKRV